MRSLPTHCDTEVIPREIQIVIAVWLATCTLAAVLERPFVAKSGIREHTLALSFQANLLSAVLGFTTFPFLFSLDFIGAGVLILIGCAVEIGYLTWNARHTIRVAWIFAGNLTSTGTILVVFFTVVSLDAHHPQLWLRMLSYEPIFRWLSFGVCGGSLAYFAMHRVFRRYPRPDTDGDMLGSEVTNSEERQSRA